MEKFQLQKTQREKKNAHKWTCSTTCSTTTNQSSVPASVGRTFLGTAPFSEPGDALRVVPPPGAPRTACSPSRTTP